MPVLVYLDTAHLDWIERVLLSSPVDARRFFERWKDSGYELAVSYHHVEECAQLASDTSINRRLLVFWEFPSVWYAQPGSGQVRAREIEAQLLGLSAASPRTDYGRLRSTLFRRVKPEAIRRDLFEALAQLRRGRVLHEMAATLDNTFAEFPDLLRTAGIKPRRWRNSVFTMQMAKLFASLRMVKLPPPIDILAGAQERLARAAAEGISVREAFERFCLLEGVRVLPVAPDADLPELSVFFFVARQVASEMDRLAGGEVARFIERVPYLNPYECPGFRLRLAPLRARGSTPRRAVPGDMVDADHLVYAAHVDRAMVDKRTLHFLRQEARRSAVLLPEEAVSHIRSSSSLDDLFPLS